MSDYPYKIVLFPDDEGTKHSIDVAFEGWISSSEKHKSKICRFPCGPFSQADVDKLHKMVKARQPADESWPAHRVLIIGKSKTYPEALKSVKRAEYEPYALSTDRESSVERTNQEENNPRAMRDGKEKDLDEEFGDAVFELVNGQPSYEKKRQPRKPSSKGPPMSKFQSPLSDKSTTKDSEKERDETHEDDEFTPLDAGTDDLERSLEKIDLNDFANSQKSNSARLSAVKKSKTRSSKKSTAQSQCSSSSLERPSPKIPTEKSSTLPANNDSPVFERPPERPMSGNYYCSSEGDSDSLCGDESSDGGSPRSLKDGVNLTPNRRTNLTNRTLDQTLNQSSKKRKRRSSSAGNFRQEKREKNRRSSRSMERSSPRRSEGSPKEPESVIAAVNQLLSYMKEVHNSLSSRIDRLRGGQLETNGHIQELKNSIEQNPRQQEFGNLEHDDLSYGEITLPVNSKREFYLFDAALKDREYLKRVANRIRLMIGNQTEITTSSLGSILRIFMTKPVVHEEFTALRGTEKKDAFANTSLDKLLRVIYRRVLKDKIDDKMFDRKLKAVFNSSGDWDGGRLERTRN